MAVLADALHRLALFGGTVAVSPGSENVEALQSEAGRIDLRMATGARFDRSMLVKLLTDRRRAPCIRLYGRNAGRWRRWRITQNPLHDPGASKNGRCCRSIRSNL